MISSLLGIAALLTFGLAGCDNSEVSRKVTPEQKEEAISRRQQYIENMQGATPEQKAALKAGIGGQAPTGQNAAKEAAEGKTNESDR